MAPKLAARFGRDLREQLPADDAHASLLQGLLKHALAQEALLAVADLFNLAVVALEAAGQHDHHVEVVLDFVQQEVLDFFRGLMVGLADVVLLGTAQPEVHGARKSPEGLD